MVVEAAADVLEAACRQCQKLGPPPRVLIVGGQESGRQSLIDVYYDRGVVVRFVEMVDRDLCNPQRERLVEELLEAKLPNNWVYLTGGSPDIRRENYVFAGLWPEQAVQDVLRMDWLWLLREFRKTGAK
jgi:hypothetical protein